jgi:hypothetical protein
MSNAPISPESQFRTALEWIGVSDRDQRDRLVAEFVSTASDFKLMDEDDVDSAIKSFASASKEQFFHYFF